MVSTTQSISVLDHFCVGVMWDYSDESTLLTRLEPESDPNGYVNVSISAKPIPAIGGTFGSSPFDSISPWSGMEEYNIVNGEVLYKKGDPEFSRSNDTVVSIPEFYYDCIDNETEKKRYWYISDKETQGMQKHPGSNKYISKYKVDSGIISKSGVKFYTSQSISSATAKCTNKGVGFHLCTIQVWSAVQLLYLIEFANWDSQTAIGGGIFVQYVSTGLTDFMDYHTGRASDTEWPQVVYRGIEGFFGNALQLLSNVKVSSRIYSISMDEKTYEEIGEFSGPSVSGNTPLVSVTELVFNENYKFVFLPKTTISNGNGKYIPDTIYVLEESSAGLTVGGWQNQNYNGGLFSYYMSNGGTKNYGFRYIFDPEEKAEEVV